MEIVFQGPTFLCPEDEERFFEWLYSLASFESIVGQGTLLTLRLRGPVDAGSARQLKVIFHRWELEADALAVLSSAASS
jgi:hypothetical protein